MIKAVLDACVLYPASLRDFLLRLAKYKTYEPFWTNEIQNEWVENLLEDRPDLRRERLERTCQEMKKEFPGSLLVGYEEIIPTLQLPDANDRHVLAAAIQVKAAFIVTNNLKDFPRDTLALHKTEAISPDRFIQQLIDYDPNVILSAVAHHRASLLRPPKTPDEYLSTLENQGLTKTVAFLREHRNEI